jgi:NTE family protein
MKKFLQTILILLFTVRINAQTGPIIRNLIFEGAGLRGIAYCGAIMELESQNLMAGIEKTAGTSAGAIMALTVSLGYSGNEIKEIIAATDFKKFNDGRYFFIGGINRTSKHYGWYRGKRFEKWLNKVILKKTGDENITFEELKKKGFKDLYITGTCLNRQQLIIFSNKTYPHMKVKDAVRISMSIPLYFEAVFIDSIGNVVRKPKKKESYEGLDLMVDGGIMGNFPIHIFDSAGYKNPATLGFRIDSDEQIQNDLGDKRLAFMPVKNFKQYMAAFYNVVMENLNRQQLKIEDWARTISISDGKIKPRIRKLSDSEKNVLINSGRQAVKNYLNTK